MLKLDASVVLLLILCSVPAFAREPAIAVDGAIDPVMSEVEPRMLHRLPPDADVPDEAERDAPRSKAAQAARDGLLSPFTSGAAITKLRATASTLGGYDTAAVEPRARAMAEGKITGFLALRVEFEHGPATGTEDRLSVGARLGLLQQRLYGIDLGAGVFYQPKDFRSEGDAVLGLFVARHFERLGLFANALFGTDTEGDDQSLELRLGSLYRASDWLTFGVDGRSRVNLSQDSKRSQARSVDWELQSGATAIVCLGQFSLLALVGPSFLKATPPAGEENGDSHLRGGLLAMAGAGSAF